MIVTRELCILIMVLGCSSVYSDYIDQEIIMNLHNSKCSESSYNDFNQQEFAATVIIGEECSENYLNRFEIPKSEILFVFSRLVVSEHFDLAKELFKEVTTYLNKQLLQQIIVEGYFYGMNIELYRGAYTEKYQDFALLKKNIIKEYGE